MMPKIAEGDANKVWIVPSEIGKALEGLGSTMNSMRGIPDDVDGPAKRVDMGSTVPDVATIEADNRRALADTHSAVEEAIAAAQESERGTRSPAAGDVPPATDGGAGSTPPQ
jgi:hypothetical protein